MAKKVKWLSRARKEKKPKMLSLTHCIVLLSISCKHGTQLTKEHFAFSSRILCASRELLLPFTAFSPSFSVPENKGRTSSYL